MARRLTLVLVLILALAGCGGGSGGKPCTGGTDPLGRACTKNSDCSVTCVCEKSGGKRYRVTASLCRATSTCASATTMCTEACLISLGSWTDNFCTR
jgi:hypothetical protein